MARWNSPYNELITLILMCCGLRITDAINLPSDCIVYDGDGAPYLRYLNHKMKREALVPIDTGLVEAILAQRRRLQPRWPAGTSVLFPRTDHNEDGQEPVSGSGYRTGLHRWVKRCDVRDEHGVPVHVVPHTLRHTLGTRLINRDVPQEVVRRILDHDSHVMTAHYARLSDTTIRRHWEAARKVSIPGVMLGFIPSESVVVLGIKGNRVEFCARMDLDHAHSDTATIAAQVDIASGALPGIELYVLGYSTDQDTAATMAPLIDAIEAIVVECIAVTPSHWCCVLMLPVWGTQHENCGAPHRMRRSSSVKW